MQDTLVRAEPEHYFVPPYVGHRGWLGVRLDRGLDWIDPAHAEVAFEISDAMRGRGLGTILLGQLADLAHRAGITELIADVLPENHRMVGVFRASGFPVKVSAEPGQLTVRFPTALPAG